MSYFTELHTLNNIFSLLLVALIITIFEICFFYIIMVPRIRTNVNQNINNISNKFKNTNISINIRIDNLLTKIFIDNEELFNNINSSIKNEIINEIKKEIKNEIINEINNKINNKNEIIENEIIENEIIENEIIENEIIENEIIENDNDIIENFDETYVKNQRKYKPLFDKTVADEISNIIIKILEKNNIELNENYKDYIKKLVTMDFDSKILSVLYTLKHDEQHIIDINNNNTFIISFTVVIIILLLLKILYNNISLVNIKIGGGVDKKIYITSFIIIIFIILFLINFYFFGITYKYKGDEELLHFIFDNINL